MRKVVIINGYDLKDLIKKFGGVFRAADKVWIISQEGFEKLLKFNSAGAGMATFRAFGKITAYSEI